MGNPRAKNTVKQLERLEPRQFLAADAFRSFDGTANNLLHPTWGTVNQLLLRDAPSAYADGQSAPAGADRPSAREVSNTVLQHHRAEDIFNERHMSAFSYAFGQFIDHDLSLTLDARPREPMRIPVPEGDVFFDPFYTGTQTIPFNRSEWVGGITPGSVRENPSVVTAYLDGSAVYGSDPVRAVALRTFAGGQLKTSDGNMLPYNTASLPNHAAFPGDDPPKD